MLSMNQYINYGPTLKGNNEPACRNFKCFDAINQTMKKEIISLSCKMLRLEKYVLSLEKEVIFLRGELNHLKQGQTGIDIDVDTLFFLITKGHKNRGKNKILKNPKICKDALSLLFKNKDISYREVSDELERIHGIKISTSSLGRFWGHCQDLILGSKKPK
jgi:hypothetical protein